MCVRCQSAGLRGTSDERRTCGFRIKVFGDYEKRFGRAGDTVIRYHG